MNPAREFVAMPDRCPGQISWDYDHTEIIADGVVRVLIKSRLFGNRWPRRKRRVRLRGNVQAIF